LQPDKRKCPEATDPRGAKDSIASGAIGRLNIKGLLRVLAKQALVIKTGRDAARIHALSDRHLMPVASGC
jgi:hypothetical protein